MPSYLLAIDTGGTFTDCLATDSDGQTHRRKVLSNGTVRGTVLEQLSPTAFRISTNWDLTRDVLRGFTFRFWEKMKQHGLRNSTRWSGC